jgi:hypothetical protein
MTKREFRKEYEPYFKNFSPEELATILMWVAQMVEMDMWIQLVDYSMMRIEEQKIMDEVLADEESVPENQTVH